MFKFGVQGAAPLVGYRGSAPGGVQGATPLAGSRGSAPGGGEKIRGGYVILRKYNDPSALI